jgi:hypothetical protein
MNCKNRAGLFLLGLGLFLYLFPSISGTGMSPLLDFLDGFLNGLSISSLIIGLLLLILPGEFLGFTSQRS